MLYWGDVGQVSTYVVFGSEGELSAWLVGSWLVSKRGSANFGRGEGKQRCFLGISCLCVLLDSEGDADSENENRTGSSRG